MDIVEKMRLPRRFSKSIYQAGMDEMNAFKFQAYLFRCFGISKLNSSLILRSMMTAEEGQRDIHEPTQRFQKLWTHSNERGTSRRH